jgi:ergothioneine biosynthesis protein EgtB
MHPALAMRTDLEDRAVLKERFERTRAQTESLTEPLEPEDCQVQTMDDVSPTKWHLAHTTWFFETFIALRFKAGYERADALHGFLYNSYYEALGKRWSRPDRGLLSRPLLREVEAYRQRITKITAELIETVSDNEWSELAPLIELGINHEQQHQELICTDIKHVLSRSPRPFAPYEQRGPQAAGHGAGDVNWLGFEGGVVELGAHGAGFAYDNEYPRHKRYAYDFEIASRPVTNREFRAFVEDGGYRTPSLWLSDGWDFINANSIRYPLYWREAETGWEEYTLAGLRPLDDDEPVCHVSGYEASAFAEWAGRRLPAEHELELLARHHPVRGSLLFEDARCHPGALNGTQEAQAVIGGVWEWSASAYEAYPGYEAPSGAVGEYNGKFMSSQQVLRGGSAATPADHIRDTYRNFFPPAARWQFSGIRLAKKLRT